MNRLFISIKWQLRAAFFLIRPFLALFLILNAFLWLLPPSACRSLDKNAPLLVMIINLSYVTSLLWGAIYTIWHITEKPGVRQNELWRLAEPNPWIRIFSRLAAGASIFALWLLNGWAGMELMKKFADEHHSYFRIEVHNDPASVILQITVLCPLLYLFLRQKRKEAGSTFLIILTLILAKLLSDACRLLPSAVVPAAAAAFLIVLFWRCGKQERQSDVP